MKTTLQIPAGLLDDAMKAGGCRTKTATIVLALEELIRSSRREKLLAMRGAFPDFSPNLDILRDRR